MAKNRSNKRAVDMTDKELLRALFPKPVRDELKKVVAGLKKKKPRKRTCHALKLHENKPESTR
jgi:hypothetical protein